MEVQEGVQAGLLTDHHLAECLQLEEWLKLLKGNTVLHKHSNSPCFWETRPAGCLKIHCAFGHSKPRYINGLFLPPDALMPEEVQERFLHPDNHEESPRNPDNISLPIHPPLIINLNDEDDEDDEAEEENGVLNWVPKTAEDLEEERAIKEICYKSGEYYGIQCSYECQSRKDVFSPQTETFSSPQEKELLTLDTTKIDMHKGDGNSTTKQINTTKRQRQSTGRRGPAENKPRRAHRSFGNGGDGNTTPAKINKNKREGYNSERRGSTESILGKDCTSLENRGIHTPDPKVKSKYQQKAQRKNNESAPSNPYGGEDGRKANFDSSKPRKSVYVFYRSTVVTQESQFDGSTAAPEPYRGKYSKQKEQLDKEVLCSQMENYDKYSSRSHNTPAWTKRNPRAKMFSNFKATIQQSQEDMEEKRKEEQFVDRTKR